MAPEKEQDKENVDGERMERLSNRERGHHLMFVAIALCFIDDLSGAVLKI